MKIGLISFHSFLEPGGVKQHILGLQKEFQKRGIQTKIIAPRRKWWEDYGKDVILLGTSFPLNFIGTQADLCVNFNIPAIEKVLKQEKFDILHFHNFGFPSALQILEKSRALNILTFHANLEKSKMFKDFPALLYIFNQIAQWRIDGIIGVAPLNIKVFKHYKGPKIVISNGINPEEFNPKNPRLNKFSDGKINILFVGRIEERKGLIYLLKAFKILQKNFSNLRLIIIGDGELKEECQNWVKKNDLKEVFFEGKKTGKSLASYYKTADIFVSPAIFGESFGIVLLEAMASGTPFVAFANKGYKEFLKGKLGERFLVRPKDYRALAKKIESLIKKPHLRKEMKKWGIRESQNYHWGKIADQVLEFYQLAQEERAGLSKKKRYALKYFPISTIDDLLKKLYKQDFLNWLKWPKYKELFKKLKKEVGF